MKHDIEFKIYLKKKTICFTSDVEETDLNHILWEDSRGDVKIDYTGVPFAIVGTEVRECRYGPDRKKKKVCIDYAVPIILYKKKCPKIDFFAEYGMNYYITLTNLQLYAYM